MNNLLPVYTGTLTGLYCGKVCEEVSTLQLVFVGTLEQCAEYLNRRARRGVAGDFFASTVVPAKERAGWEGVQGTTEHVVTIN